MQIKTMGRHHFISTEWLYFFFFLMENNKCQQRYAEIVPRSSPG